MRRRQFLGAAGAWLLLAGAAAAADASKPAGFGPNEGEVLTVDRNAGEIILRHGPLPEVDMPAMSMAFNVTDPRFFSKVRKGDRVRFKVGLVNGRFAITSIEPDRSPPAKQ